MARVIFNGQPGEVWQNDTGKVQYQLLVSWHNSCGQCIQFDHAIGPYWGIPLHRGCRCRQTAIPPGAQAQPYVDFMAKIDALPENRQSLVIGASNLKLVKAGVVQWGDVVTSTRIRDLREVVAREKLSVETVTRAGVRKDLAEKAHASVSTPAHQLAEQTRKELIAKLLNAGLTREQIDRAVAERLARRVTIGTGPSGGMGFAAKPSTPTPPKPPPTPKPQPKPKPAGTKVSGAIDVRARGTIKNQVNHTLDAIDAVHGDGPLPRIPVVETTDAAYEAQFRYSAKGRPKEIAVSTQAKARQLSFAHEVGHFVELAGIPRSGSPAPTVRDWPNDAHLGEWYKEATASTPIKQLEALKSTPGRSVAVTLPDGRAARVPVPYKHLAYLLSPKEIWSRCYAQYIAVRSGDRTLLDQLNARRNATGAVELPTFWGDIDFRPLADAIDRLFRKLGWRT